MAVGAHEATIMQWFRSSHVRFVIIMADPKTLAKAKDWPNFVKAVAVLSFFVLCIGFNNLFLPQHTSSVHVSSGLLCLFNDALLGSLLFLCDLEL